VLAILENGSKNIYEIASHMTWDMSYDNRKQFPPSQKWFAFGEAAAHIKFLKEEGKVEKEIQGKNTVYSITR